MWLSWHIRQPFGGNQTARQCKRGKKPSPRSGQAKSPWQTICKILLRSHASRPFGEHVRAWVGPQQSTLVSATKLKVKEDEDDASQPDQVEDEDGDVDGE